MVTNKFWGLKEVEMYKLRFGVCMVSVNFYTARKMKIDCWINERVDPSDMNHINIC